MEVLILKSTEDALHKMKFSIKHFFSKCDQIRGKLRIWSHLLKKSLMDNFIFCVVTVSGIYFSVKPTTYSLLYGF